MTLVPGRNPASRRWPDWPRSEAVAAHERWLASAWERVNKIERRIEILEETEARKMEILNHMQKHRVQSYLRGKLAK